MESFLPEADRDYLKEKGYIYQEYSDGAQKGIIFSGWKLPDGKYNLSEVDLLILIPSGYRDTPLDMFYNYPNIILIGEQKQAKATEATHVFQTRTWQRWSRHLAGGAWRPGVDGLHTFIQAVQKALIEARP